MNMMNIGNTAVVGMLCLWLGGCGHVNAADVKPAGSVAARAIGTSVAELAAHAEDAAYEGKQVSVEANLRIARGLDYYTGTVVEIFMAGYERLKSVGGGGRYDALASDGRTTYPGVGVSFGVSRTLVPLLADGVLAGSRPVPSAVLVALADYSRPATAQTHVGRFVGQVLHGGAWTEVHRKANAALSTFGWTVGTFVAVIALVALVLTWPRVLRAVEAVPGLRAGATAATATAVLGVCLNDSGIPIAAMAVMVGLSAVYGAVGGRDSGVAGGRPPLPATHAPPG